MPVTRPIRRILVAVKELTAKALPALEKAGQLARALDAELVLFHAFGEPLDLEADVARSGGLTGSERKTRAATVARLEQRALPLRSLGLRVSVCAEWDYPAYEAVLAAVDPDHRYAKPERLDREILQTSAVFARALRGTLHVVHAYSPLPLTAYTRGTLSEDIVRDMHRRSTRAAAEKVERLVRPLRVPASRQHRVPRHPSDAIEQAAAETDSAIVVMGALARSGLKRLLIGNTAERVLDHLSCDLLVIKPRGFRGKVPRRRRGARYASFRSGVPFY